MEHGKASTYTVRGCRCAECTEAHRVAARDLKARRKVQFDEAVASEFNTVRGRILGLIESWGLPERQERGCKSTFKSLTYDAEASIKELWK
jgi:hypothetical protein